MENEMTNLRIASNNYFEILVTTLSSLRQGKQPFYRKICELFSTSIDFDPKADAAKKFINAVERKFHWARESHASGEVFLLARDIGDVLSALPTLGVNGAQKPNSVRMPQWESSLELDRIVSRYIDYAILKAQQCSVMQMQSWTDKLQGFLALNDGDLAFHHAQLCLENFQYHCGEIEVVKEFGSRHALPQSSATNGRAVIRHQQKASSS